MTTNIVSVAGSDWIIKTFLWPFEKEWMNWKPHFIKCVVIWIQEQRSISPHSHHVVSRPHSSGASLELQCSPNRAKAQSDENQGRTDACSPVTHTSHYVIFTLAWLLHNYESSQSGVHRCFSITSNHKIEQCWNNVHKSLFCFRWHYFDFLYFHSCHIGK